MNKQWILSVAKQMNDPGDLFFNEDTANGGVGDVIFDDFEWDRSKSNICVRDKGFSFYYAVQAFYDEYKALGLDPNSPIHEDRHLVIGHPYGITSENLLVVVHVDVIGEGRFRVVSAFEAEDGSWYEKFYIKNKERWIQINKRRHFK